MRRRADILKGLLRSYSAWPLKVALVVALIGLGIGCASLPCHRADVTEPFSIIALPDTQKYTLYHPEIYLDQTRWIAENAEEMNLLCVVHEGDITDENSVKEWRVADEAMSMLDGVAPYCMVVGNHDTGEGGRAEDRSTQLFNKYFPVSRFEQEPWFGGHYEGGTENAYYLFEAGDMRFLVVCLEFGPRDEVLDWANRVVAEHKGHRTIVVTHCYLNYDNKRVDDNAEYNTHTYVIGVNDGEQMWDKFIRKHPNIFLVLSGHIAGDGVGRLTSTADHGNEVHQVVADYQMLENGGNGWLRIMKFVPQNDKIVVRTYSPWLKQYAEDDQNRFTLDYEME